MFKLGCISRQTRGPILLRMNGHTFILTLVGAFVPCIGQML